MAAGNQRLPAPPAPVEVSELKLASWKRQMLKHLTPEIIAHPSHARLGFLGPNMAQAAGIAQVPRVPLHLPGNEFKGCFRQPGRRLFCHESKAETVTLTEISLQSQLFLHPGSFCPSYVDQRGPYKCQSFQHPASFCHLSHELQNALVNLTKAFMVIVLIISSISFTARIYRKAL